MLAVEVVIGREQELRWVCYRGAFGMEPVSADWSKGSVRVRGIPESDTVIILPLHWRTMSSRFLSLPQ